MQSFSLPTDLSADLCILHPKLGKVGGATFLPDAWSPKPKELVIKLSQNRAQILLIFTHRLFSCTVKKLKRSVIKNIESSNVSE